MFPILAFIIISLATAIQNGYDYIIMGGGTGGLVVANRLSEDPNVSVPWNRDPNGGRVRGFTVHPATIEAGEYVRSDAARAYYWPVLFRMNLHVMCNTTGDRIIWEEREGDDLVAVGVEVRDENGSRVIHVKREVILAAGVFRSPVILQLLGVGNRRILEKHGITTRIDLPTVGENLQEQINNSMAVSTHEKISGSRSTAYVSASDIFGEEVGGIANSLAAKLPQYARQAAKANGDTNTTNLECLFNIQYDLIFNKSVPIAEFRVNPGNKAKTAGYWGLLPFSRGNVHIASADPTERPIINPNYGVVDFDIEFQVAMAKFVRQMFHSRPLNGLVASESHPGYDRIPEESPDDIWREWIRNEYLTNYHPIGTLAMMPRSMGGVVDHRLKVYGTRNVRVVDASIHPIQLCGHPTSSIYAIGEMVSDFIKAEWVKERADCRDE
ncbi:alcohol oxidase [Aspergillus steynii IBT 23096]|uniref:glucose oxidase n=1 Tax=Aspergillus steynii IBT 23096 TaxID=1392250 RepID=A0A2I2GKC0_9EURO|nr:alcohol oxidase [Aspergillus steynii IBT 23096]PLB53324.1 alcohol oxidase [Aspergillus steynii IBT 23096]